ncbi:MAG: hypothetical protein CL873_02935 [Dehalococcoidales bacterium]|nr:hypothetical protein [Dehalococcoidales bacterium]
MTKKRQYGRITLENRIRQRLGTRLVSPQRGLRELGKVRAGADAGVEWARELQTERDLYQVGFDGKGIVTGARDIAAKIVELYLKRDDCCFW